MPKISVTFRDFPSGHSLSKTPTRTLDFKVSELVWAAMSVGKGQVADMKAHANFSRLERRFRSYMLQAHFLIDSKGAVQPSSLFIGMDPSEKSAVSYFAGMAVTKLLLWRYFKVRWLMHLDVFHKDFSLKVGASERPDLFGIDDSGGWHVVESKGRSRGHDLAALKKAKDQAKKVMSISGRAPKLSLGVLTYFSGKGLRCSVADPEPERDGGFSMSTEVHRFLDEYYKSIIEMVGATPQAQRGERTLDGISYQTAELDDSGIAIGYDVRIPDLVRKTMLFDTPSFLGSEINPRAPEPRDARHFVGPDGILIELDERWDLVAMKKEPQER